MTDLTPKQQQKLEKALSIAVEGDISIADYLFELDDKIDDTEETLKKKLGEATDTITQRIENIQLQKGDRGEDGKDGRDGRGGVDGKDGKDGIDGVNGKDGKDGRDGVNGINGKDGKDGIDGSPDTAEDIRNKLELLSGDERLDSKYIKGIKTYDAEIATLQNRTQLLNQIATTRVQTSTGSSTFLGLTDTPSSYSGQAGKVVSVNVGETALEFITSPAGVTDHGLLTGLLDDDHTQYALLAGRSGGQTLTGGTAASNNLVLRSTTNGTKGQVYVDETTASTSVTTGALRVGGGVGISGRTWTAGMTTTGTVLPSSNQTIGVGSQTARFGITWARRYKSIDDDSSGGTNSTVFNTYGTGHLYNAGSLGTRDFIVGYNDGLGTEFPSWGIHSIFTDTAGDISTVYNNGNASVMIGGASCFATGGVTPCTATAYSSNDNSVLFATAFSGFYDNINSTASSLGIASFVAGVAGSYAAANATNTLQATGGIAGGTGGCVALGVASCSATAGVAEITSSGVYASVAIGGVTRGYLRSTNNAAMTVGYVSTTSDTAGVTNAAQGGLVVTRHAGSGNISTSGNCVLSVVNLTAPSSGGHTQSGSASLSVLQLTSSGTGTLSAAGSLLVGRAASTGSLSVTGTAGNFVIADAGTVGASASGTINCGQIGQGANSTSSSVQFAATVMIDYGNTRVGIGQTTPTAKLHLGAGSTTASSAPIKLTSGTNMTTAEAGAIEFTTDDFFATITTGAARKAFVLDDGTRLTSGKIPVATTNGRLVDMTASSAYTPSNVTTDRSYNANATTLDELADIVGTMIADLQAKGILG